MARRMRDTNLATRNSRRSFKVHNKPHWKALDKGLHLGYRKRANGGSWIARRFTESGRYSESRLGAADDFQDADGIRILNYSQAQDMAREWYSREVRIEAGMEAKQKGPYTVSDAMKDYIDNYKVEGRGLSVVETINNAHIVPLLGAVEVAKLSSKKIADWHKSLASAPARLRTSKKAEKRNTRKVDKTDADVQRRRRATANRIMTVLKAALNYAWKESKVSSDTAWRKVKPFRNVDAPVIRYLTEAECKRLVNTCPEDLRKMVQAALFTGCRYSELGNLKADDFNPDAGTVAVRISKGGKPRHVVLNEEGQRFFENAVVGKKGTDIIFTHDDGVMWGKSHQSRPLLEACKKAKIVPAISFHVLRHTHGSLLAMQGVPMPVIAKQLGHSDTRMTEKHYAHLSPSYVADTIRENFPTLGIATDGNVVSMKRRSK